MKRNYIVCFGLLILCFLSSSANAQIFPTVTLNPNPLEFSDTRVGSTSDPVTLTATAVGGQIPAGILLVKLGDTSSFGIVLDECTGAVLKNGDSCDIELNFSPGLKGHYSTTVSLISISREVISTAVVEGNGIAPAVVLSTTNIDFGDQTVNKPSAEYEVLMVNSGNTDLSITDIVASANFSVTDDCGDTLPAASSCNIGVTFTPDAVTPFTGTVTISDDASDSPQVISLAGNGVPVGTKDISLSRNEVPFGSQLVGTVSPIQKVRILNTGTVAVNVNSITVSENFALSHDCGASIAPDGECFMDITFLPGETGAFSGTAIVDTDAAEGVLQVALTGNGIENAGPQANLSAASLNFGDQEINTKSDPQVVDLINSGDEPLVINDVQAGGDHPEGYDIQDDCHKTTVLPGGSCKITVTFEPDESGSISASIKITDNAANTPQTIMLYGVGVGPSEGGGGCSIAESSKNDPACCLIIFAGVSLIIFLRRRCIFSKSYRVRRQNNIEL